MVAKIFIDGEAGTTGLQIRERLEGRRDVEVISIDPAKRKDQDERKRLLNAADVAILCLPDDAARESVALIDNDTTRVIDASTAHRTAEGWVYGFAEMAQDQPQAIADARRVANPGCWPQGPIATLRPLVEAGLLPADHPLTIHGITGYSGGGRQMIEDYEERGDAANEFQLYGLGFRHKHLPELQHYARLAYPPLFTPAIGNFRQGMVTVVPLQLGTLATPPSVADIHAVIAGHHAAIADSVVDVAPLTGDERLAEMNPEAFNDTNRMRLYVFGNDDRAQAILVAVYDNLGKGASGAAVQNLNLMLGLKADASLAA